MYYDHYHYHYYYSFSSLRRDLHLRVELGLRLLVCLQRVYAPARLSATGMQSTLISCDY